MKSTILPFITEMKDKEHDDTFLISKRDGGILPTLPSYLYVLNLVFKIVENQEQLLQLKVVAAATGLISFSPRTIIPY